MVGGRGGKLVLAWLIPEDSGPEAPRGRTSTAPALRSSCAEIRAMIARSMSLILLRSGDSVSCGFSTCTAQNLD